MLCCKCHLPNFISSCTCHSGANRSWASASNYTSIPSTSTTNQYGSWKAHLTILHACRESAVGSQFNTARVDLLADMVLQRFIQALDLPLPNDLPIQGPAEDDEPPSTGASPGTSEASRSSITKRPKAEPPSPPSVQSSSAVASNPLTSTPPNLSGSEPSNEGESGREQDPIGNANSPESITSSDADSAAPPRQPGASTDAKSSSDSNESESPPPTAPTSDAASAAPAQKSGASNADKLPRLPSLAALQRPQRVPHLAEHPALPPLLRSHSALFLHVASDVLFNMHGYRCDTHSYLSCLFDAQCTR